jgi:hypothetical protein
MGGLLRLGFFKEINMSLTKNSQRKQIIGIILVAVFLLIIFVYGTREYRCSRECALNAKNESSAAETCQAENLSCPVEIPAVR